jgi:predicted HTH transcriptional regulator
MIDFENIESYKENNRIEAKKAVGGLPHSIWETYSAFANTLGGIILLGVEEYRDKTFHPVKLPDPEFLVSDFWELLRDPKNASVNILSPDDVTIEEVEGKRIVAIRVPRAPRHLRPIYIDGNPMTGTYRRNGEGDYRCSPEAVREMMKKASDQNAMPIPAQVRAIVVYLTEKIKAPTGELSALLGTEDAETEAILADLIAKEIVTAENGIYQLKS